MCINIEICPECNGKGRVLQCALYPSGHTEFYETCITCDGEGEIEIDTEWYDAY